MMELNRITEAIIGAAIEVHRHLGPGLLESAYVRCLRHELMLRGIAFESEKELPVRYRGILLDCGYRLDLLVLGQVVVEVKAVEQLDPIHEAQLLTYLRLGGWSVGLLINFNVQVLRDGIRRRVLGLREGAKASLRLLRDLCVSAVSLCHVQTRLQMQTHRM